MLQSLNFTIRENSADLRFQLYIEPAPGPRLTWRAGCAGEVELVIDQDVGGQTPLHESLEVRSDYWIRSIARCRLSDILVGNF